LLVGGLVLGEEVYKQEDEPSRPQKIATNNAKENIPAASLPKSLKRKVGVEEAIEAGATAKTPFRLISFFFVVTF
jgi:hypothetical protein